MQGPLDRWTSIKDLFGAALELEPTLRSKFLRERCSDTEICSEVERLLTEHEEAGTFLSTPFLENTRVAGSALPPSRLKAGELFAARFRISHFIASGGMGEVYAADDTQLERTVALKFLTSESARERRSLVLFQREAKSASALNHPNICTVYDVGEDRGRAFIAMEFLEGETLGARLKRGPCTPEEGLQIAISISSALVAAHGKGIIHRDIKPGNIMLTATGAKLLDFGLASHSRFLSGEPQTTATLAGEANVVGTLPYMSPEQLRCEETDDRSDIFSLGAVLYEMFTGKGAFKGLSTVDTIAAITNGEPTPIRELTKNLPDGLETLVRRCLRKKPNERFPLMSDVEHALRECLESASEPASGINVKVLIRHIRRPRVAIPALIVFTVLATLSALWIQRGLRVRWARQHAIPEMERLVESGQYAKAAAIAREARTILPADRTIEKLWTQSTGEVSIASLPTEAEVSIRPYRGDPNAWRPLGKTPLKKLRVPRDVYVWRLVKPGYAPMFFIDEPPDPPEPGFKSDLDRALNLRPAKSVPADMVVVSGGWTGLAFPKQTAPFVQIDDFLIDRHEVTNEQYKKFIDAGGYERREFWKYPFLRNGEKISWEEAVAEFRDATGLPGPATWEAGSYPNGTEQYPVAGVSWYEAAAYAEFVGKSLPTAYHWTLASQAEDFTSLIASGSNFRRAGTQPVGSAGTLSGYGTTDMAGNVKEWCLNEERDGKRFILGGGFGEPTYMYLQSDEQSPWERRADFGFRCVKLDSAARDDATAKIEVKMRDLSKEKPVSAETFKAYLAEYVYDKGELNPQVEETQTTATWTRVKVSFDAAYGHERVIAYLFLPKLGSPPFQTVVYFPGAFAILDQNFDASGIESSDSLQFVINSGRALLFPIYKGTYQRRDGMKLGGKPPAIFRDHVIEFSKDLGRSLDYLGKRKDIDATKVAYFGASFGGVQGTIMAAVDNRIKVMILSSGGIALRHDLPDVDPFNFAPHVTIPVLMISGRYDDVFPLESSQGPLFRALGTPAKDKKQVIYEDGHGTFPHPEAIRECLNWLDKYLGPVQH